MLSPRLPHARNAALIALVAGALAASTTMSGCWKPGGIGVSLDAYTYLSSEYEPKTVTIIDTRSGQAIWSYDVPVGKELVFRFYPKHDDGNYTYPDMMRWDLWDGGRQFGEPTQKFLVPTASARKIDVRLRPVPEYAIPPIN